MQEILDNNLDPQLSRLSDAQLVGLLAHSPRLSLEFGALLQQEINRRNLSPIQIQAIQIH